MYKSRELFILACFSSLFLILSCSRTNRYSRYNTAGEDQGKTVLRNDPIDLSLSFPAEYKIENKVPYQEYRSARNLLPNKFPVKYRYLLYKAHAPGSGFTHYAWRVPAQLIDTPGLAALPQWKKEGNYLYTIDTASVPATALMLAVYPGQEAHYVFLVKAEAFNEQSLPFKAEQMKEEYAEILEGLQAP